MAVITKTIGTTSRDYSTITSWESDLDNGAVYSASDDAVGEIYDDSNFDETVTLNGGTTIGLATRKLTVPSAERHDGTRGTGAKNLLSTNRTFSVSGAIDTTLEWFEHDNNEFEYGNNGIDLDVGSAIVWFANNLCYDYNNSGTTLGVNLGSRGHLINNMLFEINPTGTQDVLGMNIGGASGETPKTGSNNTLYRINGNSNVSISGFQGRDSASHSYQNNIVVATTNTGAGGLEDFDTLSYSSATCSHNMSSDTTASGTGSLDNGVAADIFTSTTAGSEDLHLKSGASVDPIDAGTDLVTTPTGINIDIDGRDRDAEGDTWDMGADEFVSAATDLSINVNDSITITDVDTVTVGPSSLNPNVFDAITITEDVDVLRDGARDVDVFDDVTITDVDTVFVSGPTLEVNVFDSLTITEDVDVTRDQARDVNVSDQLNITELIGVIIGEPPAELDINVNDSLTITEDVTVVVGPSSLNPDVNDSLTITEDVTVTLPDALAIDVNDAITITEDVTVALPDALAININDAITITEAVTVAVVVPGATLSIDVNDSLTISEAIAISFGEGTTCLKYNKFERQWEFYINSVLIGVVNGGLTHTEIATITSAITLSKNQLTVLCDATSAAFTVTLPPATDHSGRIYNIKKIDSSSNAVTVDGNAAETIDGATTQVIQFQYDAMDIHCDGTSWHII